MEPAHQPERPDSAPQANARFENLVHAHYRPLYQFAYSLAGNPAAAADLTPQTFYTWAAKGSQLRDASKVMSWLFYVGDFADQEIAAILGLPMGTEKSRLARGIGQLHRRLAPPGCIPARLPSIMITPEQAKAIFSTRRPVRQAWTIPNWPKHSG